MMNTNDMSDSIKTEDGLGTQVTFNRPVADVMPALKGRLDATITRVDGTVEVLPTSYNSRVNAGANGEAYLLFGATGTTSVSGQFNYIELSSSAITPAAGDTALAGVISGSGLGIVQVIPSYSAPSSVGGQYSLIYSHSYTATASATVNSLALTNAGAATLFSEAAFGSTATLSSGDNLAITYTLSS
jgi:hypothetical protein